MEQLQDTGRIFGAFIGYKTDLQFEGLFLEFLSDGNLLVEYELMKTIGLYFSGQWYRVKLNFHFAGKVYLHFHGHYVETVFVHVCFVV